MSTDPQTPETVEAELERIHLEMVDSGNVPSGMDRLLAYLRALRASHASTDWRELCRRVRAAPIAKICLEDPFTRHARDKPRGYAGDATLLDFLYREPELLERVAREESDRGLAIMSYKIACPSASAVRWRRSHLAAELDRAIFSRRDAEILVLASGFFREGDHSVGVSSRRAKRIVAIDQDAQSIEAVRERFPWIEGSTQDLRFILRERAPLGRFDLVYAAGLYDYLSERFARRLTRCLAKLLKPDGRLLVANFLPDRLESGYMDSIMEWPLIYRSPRALAEVTRVEGMQHSLYQDPMHQVVYARLENHGA
jgi:SAM-dependent methyltransferase